MNLRFILMFLGVFSTVFVSQTVFCGEISSGNTDFALKTYEKLQNTDENLIFSPYSICTALSMTYAGARGETSDQIAKTLCFSLPQDEVPPAFAKLQDYLNGIQASGDVQLSIANSLWPQEGYPFLESYLQLIETYYGQEITPLDYKNAAEKARKTINRWVEDKTNGKIENLIGKGVLDSLTRLVLVNAVYFKGNWADEFDKKLTTDGIFHVNAEKTVKVPMMHAKKTCLYAENDVLQLIELPYKGNALSMVIFLPKMDENGSRTLEFTLENLKKWQKNVNTEEIELFLPKFRITWGTKSLKQSLIDLGMVLPFDDSGKADFSGMDGKPGDLYISDVLHKAFIEVNEEGTEAAAATAVAMACWAMPEPIPVFRADHPFTFIIRDNQTGSIVFMGKMSNPAE